MIKKEPKRWQFTHGHWTTDDDGRVHWHPDTMRQQEKLKDEFKEDHNLVDEAEL
jgi:hypothetical protein